MNISKHTTGKWEVMNGKSAPRICIDGDKEWPIVVTISGHSPEGIKANEKLISASPDMYDVLCEFRAHLAQRESLDQISVSTIHKLYLALNKAENDQC